MARAKTQAYRLNNIFMLVGAANAQRIELDPDVRSCFYSLWAQALKGEWVPQTTFALEAAIFEYYGEMLDAAGDSDDYDMEQEYLEYHNLAGER